MGPPSMRCCKVADVKPVCALPCWCMTFEGSADQEVPRIFLSASMMNLGVRESVCARACMCACASVPHECTRVRACFVVHMVRVHCRFKYDSTHKTWPGTVEVKDGNLIIDGHVIKGSAASDPKQIPWKDAGVDYGGCALLCVCVCVCVCSWEGLCLLSASCDVGGWAEWVRVSPALAMRSPCGMHWASFPLLGNGSGARGGMTRQGRAGAHGSGRSLACEWCRVEGAFECSRCM